MVSQGASVLSFHGGGFLGYFSALVCKALHERRGRIGARGPLGEAFDVVAGNSVGSIMAAAVAAEVDPGRVAQLMREHGEAIFPRRRFLASTPGVLGARFRQEPLRELLVAVLGDRRLGELSQALLIPAVNETRGAPVVFRSHDPEQAEIRLVDAALASSAAPFYLPLHRIAGERYADGGLVANAPELLAATDLRTRFGVPFEFQRVISIGATARPTESAAPLSRRDDWAVMGWVLRGRLQSLLLGGQMKMQGEILRGLGLFEHVHLDHLLPPDGPAHMVRADAEARATLEAAAIACIDGVDPETVDALDRALLRKRRSLVFARAGRGVYPVLA